MVGHCCRLGKYVCRHMCTTVCSYWFTILVVMEWDHREPCDEVRLHTFVFSHFSMYDWVWEDDEKVWVLPPALSLHVSDGSNFQEVPHTKQEGISDVLLGELQKWQHKVTHPVIVVDVLPARSTRQHPQRKQLDFGFSQPATYWTMHEVVSIRLP